MRLDTRIIPKKDSFKYLVFSNPRKWRHRRLMSHTAWGCLDEMEECLSSLLDRLVVPERSVGTKNSHVRKCSVMEMRMLRWMCGHTRGIRLGMK
ncbi:hypothetical protein H5410_036603 [Solanum commersonii]|uniref:Uncharacterized protein n=1 Tax=Solanum commersonii TaxID=4109 RepID=A0A9J5Y406_SOLCO|nr:hypothetical protein H5410_036603 [Solanum commersonii]